MQTAAPADPIAPLTKWYPNKTASACAQQKKTNTKEFLSHKIT